MSETELVRIVEWKQSSDEASEKVADVLGALQLEQDDHRQGIADPAQPVLLHLWASVFCFPSICTLLNGRHSVFTFL